MMHASVQRNGAKIVLESLESEGVEYIFGNPGTTEPVFLSLPMNVMEATSDVDIPDISHRWSAWSATVRPSIF